MARYIKKHHFDDIKKLSKYDRLNLRRFENLIEDKAFLQDVSKIRKHFKIPKDGYVFPEVDTEENEYYDIINYLNNLELGEGIVKLVEKYELPENFYRLVQTHVVYNEGDLFFPFDGEVPSIEIFDFSESPLNKSRIEYYTKNKKIAIVFPNDASLRNVRDFLNDNLGKYLESKKSETVEKKKKPRIKKDLKTEIDNFILHSLLDEPVNKIREEVYKKFHNKNNIKLNYENRDFYKIVKRLKEKTIEKVEI